MRKLIFATLLIFMATASHAQSPLNFGLKAGVVINNDRSTVTNERTDRDYSGTSPLGFQLGALLKLDLIGLYIQPELLYTQFKNKYKEGDVYGSQTKRRLDIPVNLGIDFLNIFHIQGGPVFSYYFKDKISFGEIERISQEKMNVGIQFGGGVKLSNILIDLRYEYSLGKNLSKFVRNNTEFNTSSRPQLLNITIGYMF